MANQKDPDDWKLLVGSVMVSFGQIEWAVNLVLRAWVAKDSHEEVIKPMLASRLLMLRVLLPSQDIGGEPNRVRFKSLLDEITRLNGERNLIAHSPIMIRVKTVKVGSTRLDAEMVIKGARKNRHMTFSQLQRVAADTEQALAGFTAASMEIARWDTAPNLDP